MRCSVHGDLYNVEDVYKSNKSVRCKKCHKKNEKNTYHTKNKFIKNDLPEDWERRGIVKTCQVHGYLYPKNAIFISESNIQCRLCKRENTKNHRIRNRDRRKIDDTYNNKVLEEYRILKRNRYGINNEEYIFMLEKQNYVCKICKNPETALFKGKIKNLAIDHCHKSEKEGKMIVRGLLCQRCNLMVGYARDSINLLQETISYLENSKNE